jgi:hypothetical protein
MSITPPTIDKTSFIRDGGVGSITVSGVDPGCTAVIYGLSAYIDGLGGVSPIGSSAGPGLTGTVAHLEYPPGDGNPGDCFFTDDYLDDNGDDDGIDFTTSGIQQGDRLAIVGGDHAGIYTVYEVRSAKVISIYETWVGMLAGTVDEGENAWAFDSGTFTIPLDLSAFYLAGDGGNEVIPFNIIAQARDSEGNYSALTESTCPPLLDVNSTPITCGQVRRSADGKKVYFTPIGLPAGSSTFLIFWQPPVGGFDDRGIWVQAGEGEVEINAGGGGPFDPETTYTFSIEAVDHNGVFHPCFGGFVSRSSVPTPLPSTTFFRSVFHHDAIYWAYLGSDEFGQAILADPIQIKCRWQDQEVMFTGGDGAQMLSVAKVYPDRDLTLEGFLMKGTLDDLNSDMLPDYGVSAFPIRAKEEHPDLRGKRFHLTVFLQKKIMSGKIKGGG